MSFGKVTKLFLVRLVSRYVPDGIDMMTRWKGCEIKSTTNSGSVQDRAQFVVVIYTGFHECLEFDIDP